MQDRCPGSVQVCAIRVARLGADGVPLPGANNLYVSNVLSRIAATPQISEGDSFEQKNGCGDIVVSLKDCDRIVRLNLELLLQKPDPELIEMLVGGEVITDGGRTVGYKYPELGQAACPDGVSIEAWSKAIVDGAQDPDFPWFRWVWPRTKWNPPPRVLENAVSETPLTGFAEENHNWFDGPVNDWAYDSDRVLQSALDTTIPAADCGYQTLAAS